MTDDALFLLAWDAVSSDAALVTFLAHVASAFDCSSAALVYKDRRTPAADVTVAHGPFNDPVVQRRYALEFSHMDPAPAAMGRLAVGAVASTDMLFDDADRHRYRAFLEGFYYPLGLVGAIGAPVSKDDDRIGVIAVHRGPSRRPFDTRDAEKLRGLVPHLAKMIDMRQAFFALDAQVARLGDALEPMTAGVMILDADGVLIEANSVARAMFARKDGLVLRRSGHVAAHDPSAADALREALSAPKADRIVRVPREADAGTYVLRVRRRDAPPGWTIVASDTTPSSGHHGGARPARVAAALGLSSPAAELLVALMDGETLNDFCGRRAMSRSTAKYHLSAAFAATGTQRQADLLRHATAIVRDLGL